MFGAQIMPIGISPLVDFAFKLMLGNPRHTRITIHFLNAILVGQPRITHVEILNPFLEKEFYDDKLSVLDILATDEHGRKLNIEMQTTLSAGLSQRLVYYVSTIYTGQLQEGSEYTELRPAISICVLSQSLFPKSSDLHLDFRLRESSSSLILTDDLQIHLLQLKNLRIIKENVYHATAVERWAFFLKNADKLTHEEIDRIFPDQEFNEAAGVLEMIARTPQQQMLYDARVKFQRDEVARLRYAEGEAREKGLEQGLEQGLKAGRMEGRLQGEARGLKLGRILVLQELLGIQASTSEELSRYDDAQLHDMAEHLQQQLRARS